jgi:hypothetical protein
MPAKTPPPTPPTIAHLRAMGLTGLSVTCGRADCHHAVDLRFDALGQADETLFAEIVQRRRFTCTRCGSGRVHLMRADSAVCKQLRVGQFDWHQRQKRESRKRMTI